MNQLSSAATSLAASAAHALGAPEGTAGPDKQAQLAPFCNAPTDKTPMTSNIGVAQAVHTISLKAGQRGPTVLEDSHLRETIHAFDHERIPERVVHARGAAYHGKFTLHTASPDITHAAVLNDTSRSTPIFTRFSTVSGSRGSADSVRDVRGFAVRFYTPEGNWDIVGNNVPIFFIQEGIQFPDLVHALKPNPKTEIPQAQTAHDNAWDWMSLSPQSTAMQLWILSDRTIPRSFAMMQGFGVHSFVCENAEGKLHFVKFHWRPHLGTHSLVWDEALNLAGFDPDFHRRDMSERIAAGAYPKWELGIQAVPYEREHDFDFDLLDSTKIIPEDDVPVRWVGTMELNREPNNYFAETEQVGFCTQHLVPGIQHSNDPLLQARSFSYADTQLSRLGSPNWQDLPINRPLCPVFNNNQDGHMRYRINTSDINYYPNRRQQMPPLPKAQGGYLEAATKIEGFKERAQSPKYQEYYKQARLFLNSMSDVERAHIIAAASFELGKCDEQEVQQAFLDNMAKVDLAFTKQIAANLDLEVADPGPEYANDKANNSAFLSQVEGKTNTFTASGRKVGLLLADGFNEAGTLALLAALKAEGIIAIVVGPRKGKVTSGATSLPTHFTYETCRSVLFDAIFVPGGNDDFMKQMSGGRCIYFARQAFAHQKALLIADNAVSWIRDIVLPTSVKSTNQTTGEDVHVETGLITAAATTPAAIKAFLTEISKHRAWARDVSAVAY